MSYPEATIATVPPASFPSNNHTLWISPVGTTEHATASSVIPIPELALQRLPAIHALPKRYRKGRKPAPDERGGDHQ
jgi:hypothetical protein